MLNESNNWDSIEAVVASGQIYDIDVTAGGVLWATGEAAVYRYDGHYVQRIPYPENPSLYKIAYTKTSTSGITYAFSHLGVYRLAGEQWVFVGKTAPAIGRHALEDNLGNIWFVTDSEVAHVNDTGVKRFDVGAKHLTDILIDHLGFIWVVDRIDSTVYKFQYKNDELTLINSWPKVGGVAGGRLIALAYLAQTDDKRIWHANRHENAPVVFLDYGQQDVWQVDEGLNAYDIGPDVSLLAGSNNSLFVHRNNSIFYYTNGEWTEHAWPFLSYSNTGKEHELVLSSDKSLFALESYLGISRLDLSGSVWGVFPDRVFQCENTQGVTFFITRKNNVVGVRPDGHEQVYLQSGEFITTPLKVSCREDGSLWVTGEYKKNAAYAVWQNQQWRQVILPKLGIAIMQDSVAFDRDGGVYLGGDVMSEDKGEFQSIAYVNKHGDVSYLDDVNRMVKKLLLRGNGDLIYGIDGGDIFSVSGFKSKSRLFKHSNSGEFQFAEDENGRFWVSSWGQGLFYMEDEKKRIEPFNIGLGDTHLTALTELNGGGVLGVNKTGLIKISQSDYIEKKIKVVQQRFGGNTAFQDKNSDIWLNQASSVWYRRYRYPVMGAAQRILSLKISNNNLAPETYYEPRDVQLNPFIDGQRLHFSAMDIWSETPVERLQFSYRLDNHAWSKFTREGFLYINNLEAGKHTIYARSRDDFGNIDETPVEIEIVIPHVFWETLWFKILFAIIVILIIVLVLAIYIQRLRNVARLESMRLSFLTNVSHELRSPLTLILAPLEKLNRNTQDESTKKSVQTALRSANRLNQLVNQLLDYRKIQLNKTILILSSGDLVAFCRILLADFENQLSLRNQQVKLDVDCEICICQFDADAMRKVLENLLTNAINYSPDGSRITVKLVTRNIKGVVLSVEDEGVGVPSNVKDLIFNPFYADANPLGDRKSFGVGLALVKELVGIMGGEISLKSPASNNQNGFEGSVFTVELPFVVEDAINEAPLDHSVVGMPSRHRLLFIDDQLELLEYLRDELSQDYDVSISTNAMQALKLAEELAPDIIISDVVMPEMTGLALCRALQDNKETNHIPIILQSAAESNEALGLEEGAIDFIKKPISLDVLRVKLRNHIVQRERITERIRHSLLVGELENENDMNSVFLQKVKKILDENISDSSFNVESIAMQMATSRSSFYRKFNSLVGVSQNELLKTYRLEKAALLLKEGMAVSAVASQVGYNDASAFSRSFKSKFGLPPSKCR